MKFLTKQQLQMLLQTIQNAQLAIEYWSQPIYDEWEEQIQNDMFACCYAIAMLTEMLKEIETIENKTEEKPK